MIALPPYNTVNLWGEDKPRRKQIADRLRQAVNEDYRTISPTRGPVKGYPSGGGVP